MGAGWAGASFTLCRIPCHCCDREIVDDRMGEIFWYAAEVGQGLFAEVCSVNSGADIAELFGRLYFSTSGRGGEVNHYGTDDS